METKEYDVTQKKHNEAPIQKETRTGSYFDGKFIGYIGYKLLALIITSVTFTIAKPWADKMLLEYKINHTIYNGKRLKFEGKGGNLFVQRLKWTLLTIVTLGIYYLWVPIKNEKWIISNVHFEDEEFNENDSYFDGKLIQLIGVNLFTYLLTIISCGLLFPFTFCYRQKWLARHTIINRKKLVFTGKATSLIGHYLLWWFLSIITLGIFALWVPIKIYDWQVKNTHIKLKDEPENKISKAPVVIGVVLTVAVVALLGVIIPKINWDFKISDIFTKKIGPIDSVKLIDNRCPSYATYNEGECTYSIDRDEDDCIAIDGEPFIENGEERCIITIDANY